MKTHLTEILRFIEEIDPVTGFPHRMLLGFSNVSSQSEHMARYSFAKSYSKGFILDLGASSCYGSSMLAGDDSNYVVSADLNRNVLLYGKKVFTRKNMDAVCCDARYLPFRSASFNTIVSIETIEHLRDPSLFLKEVNRVVKSFGLIVVSTPNKNVTSPILSTPLNPYHYKEYELKGLTRKLEIHGMKTIDAFYQTRINLYLFFARTICLVLAFLPIKLRVGLLPLRNLFKFFLVLTKTVTRSQPLDPNPSLYPLIKYVSALDCLTYYQLVILAQKSENR